MIQATSYYKIDKRCENDLTGTGRNLADTSIEQRKNIIHVKRVENGGIVGNES